MEAVKCLVIILALAYCVDGRERLGKIFKRQARSRDYKALQSPQPGFIQQSIVRNSFAEPQTAPLSASQPRASQINVPLIPPAVVQHQYHQAQHQAAHPSFSAPHQYQPIPHPGAQPSYAAQQITSPQVQQQASYQEISLQQALESPKYTQQVLQAYQTSPAWAQPISMRDESNKILLRLPSNATLIRPNIVDGFSCLGRRYGYYADVKNDCQIFHVCFPLRSVFNNDPSVPDVTYEWSFICNEFTRFAQDALTCAFTYDQVPCDQAESLYSINDHFFKITTPKPNPNVISAGPIPGSVQVPFTG